MRGMPGRMDRHQVAEGLGIHRVIGERGHQPGALLRAGHVLLRRRDRALYVHGIDLLSRVGCPERWRKSRNSFQLIKKLTTHGMGG